MVSCFSIADIIPCSSLQSKYWLLSFIGGTQSPKKRSITSYKSFFSCCPYPFDPVPLQYTSLLWWPLWSRQSPRIVYIFVSFQHSSPDDSFHWDFGRMDNLKTLCCLAPTTHLEPMQIYEWFQGKFEPVNWFWSPVSLNSGSFHRGHSFAPKSPPSILTIQVFSILVQTTYTRSQWWYCPVTNTTKQTQGTLRRPIKMCN